MVGKSTKVKKSKYDIGNVRQSDVRYTKWRNQQGKKQNNVKNTNKKEKEEEQHQNMLRKPSQQN